MIPYERFHDFLLIITVTISMSCIIFNTGKTSQIFPMPMCTRSYKISAKSLYEKTYMSVPAPSTDDKSIISTQSIHECDE